MRWAVPTQVEHRHERWTGRSLLNSRQRSYDRDAEARLRGLRIIGSRRGFDGRVGRIADWVWRCEVARGSLTGRDLPEQGAFRGANGLGHRAARSEAAAGRHGGGAWD